MLRKLLMPSLFAAPAPTATAPVAPRFVSQLWIPLLFVGLLVAMYVAVNSLQPGTIIFPLLFIFLLTGFPIALSLAIATDIYLYYSTTIPLTAIPQKMLTHLDSFPLLAAPTFILATN